MDADLQLCYLSLNSGADTGAVCKPCDFPGEMWLQLGFLFLTALDSMTQPMKAIENETSFHK